ncbi:MAG: thiol reductant ABC exporter subunit CydC [Actinomycetaceae bacterium]|nr:thiol reductant ABC exporter subunit CydC [Actinomycetaceae bacterium]
MTQAFPADERAALKRAIHMLDYDRKRFRWSVAAGSGAIGSTVGLGATSAWLIARAAQLPPVLDLSVASTGVRAFGVGKAVFRYLERIASHWVALYGMSNLRTAVYAQLADSSTDVVTSLKRGDLLTRTNADVDEIGNVVVKSMLPAAVALVVGIISVGIVGILSLPIALVLALSLFISGAVGPYFAMRGARLAELAQVEDRARLNDEALNLLENAAELRVSGRLKVMEAARLDTELAIEQHRNDAAKPTAVAGVIDTAALALAVIGALLIGTWQISQGTLNGIELVVATLTPLSAFEATARLPEAGVQLTRSGAAAKRIMAILDHAAAAVPQTATTSHTDDSGVVARDLIVGWPDGPHVAGPLNLHLEPGKALAIVGPSGIGKSTLLYTLAGMLEPHAGNVTLNGGEVSSLDRKLVSQSLTLTAEDAHIFETTILENLRVARSSVTQEEAVALLERAGLGPWLRQLPEGVETMLGTNATTISGGERRRILLARALASNAQYLLLDEPGEHLDPHTADALIRDLLNAGGSDRGIILVTHRLTPLDAADEVIVLGQASEAGPATVRARGTHRELLATLEQYAWSAEQEN